MKKMLKYFLYGIALWIMIYLIGSFIAADFNLMKWHEVLRVFIGLIGTCFTIAVFAMIYNDEL